MATARPRGRTEVVEALLASARKLIAEQGPAVPLRDIADDAGVNFGLIYQYVGTKEQLVGEVYGRAAQSAAARLAAAEHVDEALNILMTMGDGTTARLVAWAALEATQPIDAFRDSPALEVLAEFVRTDAREAGADLSAEDAKVFAALAMVLSLGWRLFAPTALSAAGLDGTEPAKYDHQMRTYLDRLAAAVTNRGLEPAQAPAGARRRSLLPRRSSRG